MSKYRFKTKQEFIRDDLWDYEYNVPLGWAPSGSMDGFLGTDIPKWLNRDCDSEEDFTFKEWNFSSRDYALREENKNWPVWVPKKEINPNGFEYFGDKLMEVSESGEVWTTRVVFGKKNGRYIAWDSHLNGGSLKGATTINDAISWKYARPIKAKLTLQEVADKFGLNKDEIEII